MNDNFIKLYKDDLVIEAYKEKIGKYDLGIWYDITSMIKTVPSYIDKVLIHIIDICTDEDIDSKTRAFVRETVKDIKSHDDMYCTGDIEYDDEIKICFNDGTCICVYGAENGGMMSIF